jgi:hypothetical protein
LGYGWTIRSDGTHWCTIFFIFSQFRLTAFWLLRRSALNQILIANPRTVLSTPEFPGTPKYSANPAAFD